MEKTCRWEIRKKELNLELNSTEEFIDEMTSTIPMIVIFNSECGMSYTGSVYKFKFCPYCGGKIVEKE